jgi:hypothetical protein
MNDCQAQAKVRDGSLSGLHFHFHLPALTDTLSPHTCIFCCGQLCWEKSSEMAERFRFSHTVQRLPSHVAFSHTVQRPLSHVARFFSQQSVDQSLCMRH